MINGTKESNSGPLSFHQLADRYLVFPNHDWSDSTRRRYRILLDNYVAGGLPDNPTTRAMTIRVVNSCNNWGYKNGLISKPVRLQGGSKWESRHRVLNKDELQLLFDEIKDERFNSFVRFAYYTGARAGEIRCLQKNSIFPKHLVVNGKSGNRIIKLNSQAREILNKRDELWSYRRDFVSHKFKKEVRRLGIPDIRFHDLRRTFGYNLIRQGRPIYEVSKLLGHSSVTTTERHYAPLLTTEIEDFVL
jgi:integrase